MTKEKIAFYSIIILFILALASAIYFFGERILILAKGNANPGRIISIIILLFYIYYLIKSLYLFSKLKRDAIETGVTSLYIGIFLSLWLYLLAPIILVADSATKIEILKNSFFFLIVDFIISIVVLVYLKRSRGIRKILIAK